MGKAKEVIPTGREPLFLPINIQDQLDGGTLRISSDEVVFRLPETDGFAGINSNSGKPGSPSEHFARIFPSHAKAYGPAIIERHLYFEDGNRWLIPLAMNEVFIACILGDARLGKLEFFPAEQQWYRHDAQEMKWEPVTEAHLKSIWTQLLNACALVMPRFVDLQPLVSFMTDTPRV